MGNIGEDGEPATTEGDGNKEEDDDGRDSGDEAEDQPQEE